jgi:hypothetical protein
MAGATATRSFLIAVLLLTATCARAVEVIVETPTKLYDTKGKVLAEVEAGQTFKAEALRGKWVYGYLPTKTGGARGWMAVDALELSEQAKRKLTDSEATQRVEAAQSALPSTKKSESDAGLLRFRLSPGDVQVYEATVTIVEDYPLERLPGQENPPSRANGRQIRKTMIQVAFSITGEKRDDEKGTITATLRYHSFRWERWYGFTHRGGPTPRLIVDEKGPRMWSTGKWIAPHDFLAESMPDVRNFLGRVITVVFSTRGGLIDPEKYWIGQRFWLEQLPWCGITGILGALPLYPKQSAKPGHAWPQDAVYAIPDLARDGRMEYLATKATYRIESLVRHRDHLCFKLVHHAKADLPKEEAEHMRDDGWKGRYEASGLAYVAEASGIPVDLSVKLSLTLTNPQAGGEQDQFYTTVLRLRYIGDKLPD